MTGGCYLFSSVSRQLWRNNSMLKNNSTYGFIGAYLLQLTVHRHTPSLCLAFRSSSYLQLCNIILSCTYSSISIRSLLISLWANKPQTFHRSLNEYNPAHARVNCFLRLSDSIFNVSTVLIFTRFEEVQNLYSTDKPSITQIVEEVDENVFNSIKYNSFHLLHQLLSRRTESS